MQNWCFFPRLYNIVFSRNEASEKIIKNIEKWSVILYLITLLLFMAFYWWDLLKNYNPPDENDHYKPMKLQN